MNDNPDEKNRDASQARLDAWPERRGRFTHVRQNAFAARIAPWLEWTAGPVLLTCSLGFYFSVTQAGSIGQPAADEATYLPAELPRYGLLDGPHSLLVEVFDPTSGGWESRRKDYVKPGEEFRALGILFKQAMHDGLSEIHEEIDIRLLDEAIRCYDAQRVRMPKPEDVVYVFGVSPLGGNLREYGFQVLRYVGAGKTFRFQGRLYRTEAVSDAGAIRVVDTGKTLAKPGGDPDAGPPEFLLTEYTQKFFPKSRLPKNLQPEGLNHDD